MRSRFFLLTYLTTAALFIVTNAFAALHVEGNDMIWDDATGLMWQRATATTTGGNDFRWGGGTEATGLCDGTANQEEDALCYCDSLGLGSYTDWRLPDRNELLSIVDYARYDPAIDPLFTNTVSFFFWTSTTVNAWDDSRDKAWFVNFLHGGAFPDTKDTEHYVRCVRGRVFQINATAGANLDITGANTGVNWVDRNGDLSVTYTVTGPNVINDVIIDLGTPNEQSLGPQGPDYTHPFTGVIDNHTIYATTAASNYLVDVTVTGAGGTVTHKGQPITAPGTQVLADYNEPLTFQVAAADHWSIGQTRYDGADVNLTSGEYTTAPVTENKAGDNGFSVTFIEDAKHTLAVTLSGTGTGSITSAPVGIDCPGACNHEYYFDETVTLTAEADQDVQFMGWSGACTGTGTCTVTMSADRTVTAEFKSGTILKFMSAIISGNTGDSSTE